LIYGNRKFMPHILITPGDPAGIGPEVIAKALQSSKLPKDCTYELLSFSEKIIAGQPSKRSAQIALDALELAAQLLNAGSADAVVTGPVSKEHLQQIGFPFPGQTEFFTDRLNATNTAMCLTGNFLTVALVTIHIPLADVTEKITTSEIVRVGLLLADFLLQKKVLHPIIAVCGLNPHAGENGTFGREEIETISPAIDLLNRSNKAIFSGPHVPDAIFRAASTGHYDAVLCMYHDQGLIPLKLLDFDNAVNITLGLPKPRLSPDHGTAFDIAGKNLANPSSMLRTLQLARDLTI
jgi:4-hydroxythreonine-4-phosphate dehydrogenase